MMATANLAVGNSPAAVLSESLITVACPVCASENRTAVYRSTIPDEAVNKVVAYSYDVLRDGHHAVVRCMDCGLVYASPRDTEAMLAQVYAGGSVLSYQREAKGKLESFRREARMLERVCGSGGPLLEIGCATGLFLRAAQEIGFDVHGCEPWVEAAALAQKDFGARVRAGAFDAAEWGSDRFRVIALWDVIEHVEQPVRLLESVHRLLRPGGWVVLSTPNFDSMSRRLLQARWQFLERPHLAYFSPATIGRLLAKCGFTEIRSGPQAKTYSFAYFAGYAAKWSPRLSEEMVRVLGRLGTPGGLMLTLPSGCMRVYARKPDHETATRSER
jgi:2-polyprenyl-3-methyl-5-hydroxy-6-metoxy-1,4-benzoquinol methylase